MKTVLIIDDDAATLASCRRALRAPDREIFTAESGQQALAIIGQHAPLLVITDLRLPDLDGLEVMKRIRKSLPDTSFIFLTGFGTVENAVEAMKEGAEDYLTKPVDLFQLRARVDRILKLKDLSDEVVSLRQQLDKRYGITGIIGRSAAIEDILDQIRQVASARATVLITGESGTGKEVIARALHFSGHRREHPFVALNCSAFSEGVIENELFGHERGAFTGADSRQIGKFEQADKGTLFLDEVGELPLSIQVKLLRFLEEREFTRLGGTQLISVDVRLIAATNSILELLVENSKFRQDLYYRLNVVRINVPPLRDRSEDIPLLADSFRTRFTEENQREILGFTPDAMSCMQRYSWPGNVRELRNLIESLVVTRRGPWIDSCDLPSEIRALGTAAPTVPKLGEIASGFVDMDTVERLHIQQTLDSVKGNRTKAAQILGIGLRTLQRKIKRYNLDQARDSE